MKKRKYDNVHELDHINSNNIIERLRCKYTSHDKKYMK